MGAEGLRRIRLSLALGFALAVLAVHGGAQASLPNPIHLDQVRQAGQVLVSAENTDPDAVRWIWLSFRFVQNAYAQPALPAGFVLQPHQTLSLCSVLPFASSSAYAYGLSESSGEGDPSRDPDSAAVYLLPYAHGTKHFISQGYFGRVSHQGLYALDFAMPDDTTICAARGGVVIAVKQDSDKGGPSTEYASDGNYVEIMHPDASWAIYAHISQGGALVQRGETVAAGDPIALSGHTGEATGPHLHFAVYRASWEGPKSIPTVFLTGLSQTSSLEEGGTYYSYHPGGPAFTPILGENLRDEDLRAITRTAQGSSVNLRQERVDRRELVWADNPTDQAVDLSVDLADSAGVRPSAALPYQVRVPAGQEVYCFHVDFVGEGTSYFKLKASWTQAN